MVSYSEQISLLKTQLFSTKPDQSLEKDLKTSKNILKAYESEILSLKSSIVDLEMKNRNYEDNEKKQKETIQALQNEIISKNSKILEPENSIKSQILSIELQKTIDEQREEIDDLLEQLNEYKTLSSRSTSMENYYKDELSKLQKLNKDKQVTIQDLEKKIEDLQSQKALMTRTIIEKESAKKAEKSNDEKEKNFFEGKIRALDQKIFILQESLKEAESENKELSEEIESIKEIYWMLLGLLKLKNKEIDVYKNPEKKDSELSRDLSKLKSEEKQLLEL